MDLSPEADPLEFFEERAAIIQFDGCLSRPDAEFSAAVLMRMYCERMGVDEPKNHWTRGLPRQHVIWSDEEGKPVSNWEPPRYPGRQ